MTAGFTAGFITLVVVAIIALVLTRYRVTKPDEAFIVVGRRAGGAGEKVIVSGSTFVVPVIEQLYRVSLASRPLDITTEALDSDNIPLKVEAKASVKIGGTAEDVRLAGQRFLHTQSGITQFTDGIVSGVLRAVLGEMVTRDVISNREALNQRVMSAATDALSDQGLKLDSLQILSIEDVNGYIQALGAPKDAEVKKEAARAQAIADQQAAEARIAAEQAVAEKRRDLSVKEAEFRAEVERANAKASAAGPTQQAQSDREIAEQETLTATERARLREAQLLAEVKAPAEAAAEQVRIEAEANANQIRIRGEAEADAIRAKADAFRTYGDAAMNQMILEALPEIVKQAAAPIGQIDGITVVSTDGAGDLVRQGTSAFTQVSKILDGLGIDISTFTQRNESAASADTLSVPARNATAE